MDNQDIFNHRTKIQIRISDIDAVGHVNNGVQCSYYDCGRVAYFETALGKNMNWENTDVVLVHEELDFFLPIFIHDTIFVETKVERIGNKSLTMVQQIVNQDGRIHGRCLSVLSGYDALTGQSKLIPAAYRDGIAQIENH